MNKRKSFLIHIDSLDILDDLTNEQCGELFKAIKSYQQNEEITLSAIAKIAFSPFKNQFKRDFEKYQITCERRAIAGSIGGKQKVANASKYKQDLANVADNKNKNKNKNKTNNKNKSDSKNITLTAEFDLVWSMYGKKGNRKTSQSKFNKLTDSNKKLMSEHLQNYIDSTPDKQFRKNLETYINQECWNDEILIKSSNQQSFKQGKTSNNLSNFEAFVNG